MLGRLSVLPKALRQTNMVLFKKEGHSFSNSMNKSAKTYFVTGCAGFIANRVAQLLLNAGHRVVGVDNMNDYYDVSLKHYRLAQLSQPVDSNWTERFDFFEADIEDAAALKQIFDQFSFDAVINLAGRAGVRYSMDNPVVYMSTNAMANLLLLEEIKKRDIKKYVLASTSSLYAGQSMPFVETLAVNTPISPYAATKKAAEAMAFTYHHLHNVDVSVVRYFTVYGPGDRPDMAIHRFIQWIDQGVPIQLFGDGSQARDFTYVDDIARGTIAALQSVGYEIINFGGGNQPVEINTVIQKLEKLLGKKAKVEHLPSFKADMKTTWANIDKAARLFNWKPEISLDNGLADCVNWYRNNLPWSSQIRLTTAAGPPQATSKPVKHSAREPFIFSGLGSTARTRQST